MTLMSVGSLADQVYSIKGFFAGAIEFYSSFATFIVDAFRWVRIDIPPDVIHALILLSCMYGVSSRTGIDDVDQLVSNVVYWRRLAVAVLVTAVLGRIAFYSEIPSIVSTVIGVVFVFPVLHWSQGWNTKGLQALRITMQLMFFVYFCVAVLAAVSNGLSRPL